MTNTMRSHYFHLIWSTKNREPSITSELQMRLYGYMRKILEMKKTKLLEIGGTSDHVHLIIETPQLEKYADIVRDVKALSSGWVRQNFKDHLTFSWQKGYGSFTVSYSNVFKIKHYIKNQKIHHNTVSFDNEYTELLMKHHIDQDARFYLG